MLPSARVAPTEMRIPHRLTWTLAQARFTIALYLSHSFHLHSFPSVPTMPSSGPPECKCGCCKCEAQWFQWGWICRKTFEQQQEESSVWVTPSPGKTAVLAVFAGHGQIKYFDVFGFVEVLDSLVLPGSSWFLSNQHCLNQHELDTADCTSGSGSLSGEDLDGPYQWAILIWIVMPVQVKWYVAHLALHPAGSGF